MELLSRARRPTARDRTRASFSADLRAASSGLRCIVETVHSVSFLRERLVAVSQHPCQWPYGSLLVRVIGHIRAVFCAVADEDENADEDEGNVAVSSVDWLSCALPRGEANRSKIKRPGGVLDLNLRLNLNPRMAGAIKIQMKIRIKRQLRG